MLDPEGQVRQPGTGTPPGVICVTDARPCGPALGRGSARWCEQVVKPQCRGEACRIRYADDGAPRRREGGLMSDINPRE